MELASMKSNKIPQNGIKGTNTEEVVTKVLTTSQPPMKNIISSPINRETNSVSPSSSSSQLPTLEDYLLLNVGQNPGKSTSREEIQKYRSGINTFTKKYNELILQQEVDLTNKMAKERGIDFELRKKILPQQNKKRIPLTNADIYNSPHREGGLKDMYVNHWSKIAICTIEKVASSELKKLLYRMNGDPKWRDEPWFKGVC